MLKSLKFIKKRKIFRFNSFQLFTFYKLVNLLMKNGKKDKAIFILKSILFKLLLFFKNKNPFMIFLIVILRLNFALSLKKKKIAGRTHYLPIFLNNEKQILIGLRIFIINVRLRLEKTIINKLFEEIICIYNLDVNSSVFMKKKRLLYNQVIENKFYTKFL